MRPEKRWAKTDPGLRSHPNFIDLVDELDSTPIMVDGMLHGLWSVAFFDAPDGDLSRFKPRALARAIGWPVPGKSPGHEGTTGEVLVKSLIDTGFLYRDGDRLLIHDWEDWGGALFAERIRESHKKAEQRKLAESEPTVPGKSPGHEGKSPGPSRVDRDREQDIEQDLRALAETRVPAGADDDFSEWWATYGKIGSKADAERLYHFWRGKGAESADLLTAAATYRAHCERTDCKMQHARTFLAKPPKGGRARWYEWAEGEEHGAMDVAGDDDLAAVLRAGAQTYGGNNGGPRAVREPDQPARPLGRSEDDRLGVPAQCLDEGD
jgi:hypothetical protein